jgi:hypothetical protein
MAIVKNVDEPEKYKKLAKHFINYNEMIKEYHYGAYGEATVQVFPKACLYIYHVTGAKTIYAGTRDKGLAFGNGRMTSERCRIIGNDLTSGHYTKPY